MRWEDLTIGQYQRILEITDGVAGVEADLDAEEQMLVEVAGYNRNDLDALSLKDFARTFEDEFGFLSTDMPPVKPVKIVHCGWRFYRINYDLTKVTKGTYDEVVAFSKNGLNATLHQFMASITTPVWWSRGYKDHAKRSEDMKNCKFLHAYYSSVFFWEVYRNLLKALPTSLAPKIKAMTEEESQLLATHLTNLFPIGDGTRTTSK
jgi:hypothetical protein